MSIWSDGRVPIRVLTIGFVAALATSCSFGATGTKRSSRRVDPPVFVPWKRVGDIRLGEPAKLVTREYGVRHGYFGHKATLQGWWGQGFYRLHRSKVEVDFQHGHVSVIGFSTPYYRTKSGFGVGSKIPLGPCVKTWTHRCGHVWHGFVWNEISHEQPCGCWVKIGLGKQSLRPSEATVLRPWFFIYTHRGRATAFYLALHWID